MKVKKLIGVAASLCLSFSLAACSNTGGEPATGEAEAVSQQTVSMENTVITEEKVLPSIDFADGQYGFIGLDTVVNPNADSSTIKLSEFNGKNAVEIKANGAAPFIGIQADTLLGDRIGDVSKVYLTIGTKNESFYASSGSIVSVVNGEKLDTTPWAIYKESANPKTVSLSLSTPLKKGDYIVFSLETDVAVLDMGLGQTTMYLCDIAFVDKDGNTIEADSSAKYAVDPEVDSTNLYGTNRLYSKDLSGLSEFEADENFISSLDEDSLIEVRYSSVSGKLYLSFPESAAGATVIGDTPETSGYYNNSGNIVQYTYSDLVALIGDKETWGNKISFSSDSDFTLSELSVNKIMPNYAISPSVNEIFTGESEGGTAIGLQLSDEFMDALNDDAAIEFTYHSDSSNIWMEWPDAANGQLVGAVNDKGYSTLTSDGFKCVVTCEELKAALGDDKESWGRTLNFNSDSYFSIFSVRVGDIGCFEPLRNVVKFPDFACKADTWKQNGFTMPEEIVEALQAEGAYIQISYASESGALWIVLPDSKKGWNRIGVGDISDVGNGYATYNGKISQIPVSDLYEYAGNGPEQWGSRLQCESDSPWEAYGAVVGQSNVREDE